jgi:hypothetical protein
MRSNLKLMSVLFLFAAMALSAGAVETMGLYQVTPGDRYSTYFDTVAWSYTGRGYFNIQVFFGKEDSKKDSKPGKGNNQFFLQITLDQYNKLFESNAAVKDMKLNDNLWDRTISASSQDGVRTVYMTFTNAIDGEITEVFKRGRFEVVMEKDRISSMKMLIEQKRFLNFGGYKKVFVGEAQNLKKAEHGLSLRDEGETGRVKSMKAIKFALQDKTGKSFKQAVKMDRP